MAHEIEGNSAFYVTDPAWHNLGTVLSTAPTVADAWKLAYPHELFKLDLNATVYDDSGSAHHTPVTSHKAIVRDDGKVIGVVGEGYELVQPYEAFNFFEPFIESGLVDLEAGGSLREGSRMWALAKIKGAESEIIKGDQVNGYFLVYTSFDGSLSHGIQFTGTRVVCANTLAMAIDSASQSGTYRTKHTKNINQRIEAIQARVSIANKDFNSSVEAFRTLARKRMSDSEMKAYVRRVIVGNREADQEISTKLENKVNRVIDLLEDQRGLDLVPAIRGTAWQAYNAVTEYVTHEYGRNDDTRLNAQWFGESAKMSRDALNLALAH